MSHQLVLNIPNEVFDPLAESAKNTGATPEQIAVDWLAVMSRHAAQDPLEKHIGAMQSKVSNWADEHDKHLGLSQLDAHDQAESER